MDSLEKDTLSLDMNGAFLFLGDPTCVLYSISAIFCE